MDKKVLRRAILDIRAIQLARLCSAQESNKIPVVSIDDIANKALDIAVEIMELSIDE